MLRAGTEFGTKRVGRLMQELRWNLPVPSLYEHGRSTVFAAKRGEDFRHPPIETPISRPMP